jgi:hypothetical protein
VRQQISLSADFAVPHRGLFRFHWRGKESLSASVNRELEEYVMKEMAVKPIIGAYQT